MDTNRTDEARRTEPELLSPAERRALLDLEVQKLAQAGFEVQARSDHHVVMRSPDRHRVEVFIDEFGEAYRS